MQALVRFFTNMDARVARTIGVALALFGTAAFVLILGKTTAFFDEDDAPLIAWMQDNADSPWALPATIVVFTLAAFVGAPQFVLIAAAVVAFGPLRGFGYSWVATMVSAGVTFSMGRIFGADVLKRYGGGAINRISRFVGRNGFMTAATVRIVPSAPFIVVNMAAGVSQMSPLAFFAGTGLGIVPKTALVAFAGHGLVEIAREGDWRTGAVLLAFAGLWLAAMLAARRALAGRAESEESEP